MRLVFLRDSLCSLRVSVVSLFFSYFTTETRRTTEDAQRNTFCRQTPSDGFPEGLIGQRFKRLIYSASVNSVRFERALQCDSFSSTAKAEVGRPVETGSIG
jgi:hypothetical protein